MDAAGSKTSKGDPTSQTALHKASSTLVEASENFLYTYNLFSQPTETSPNNSTVPHKLAADLLHLQKLLDSGSQYSKFCIERDLNETGTRDEVLQELRVGSDMWLKEIGNQGNVVSDRTWQNMVATVEKCLRRIGRNLQDRQDEAKE